MLQVIEGREVTGGHATLRHRVPVTNTQKRVGTPTAARGGPLAYQRTPHPPLEFQGFTVKVPEAKVDPPAPWGTRCQEPVGVRNLRGSSHPLCSLALPRVDREG
jgi:hypothetical protein